MKDLVFFTDSFPLGGVTEPSFIYPELPILIKAFNKIRILPKNNYGKGSLSGKYSNVTIDTNFLKSKKDRTSKGELFKLLLLLFRPQFFSFFIRDLRQIKTHRDLFSFLRYIDRTIEYVKYIKILVRCGKIEPSNTIFYSFWFTEETFALALLSNKYNISFCCRAHGYDIFDDRVQYRSKSIRNYTLSKIKKVFVCSNVGATYIKEAYPAYTNKIDVSYLGCQKVFDLLNPTKKEDKKIIVFFTCARFHPIKRIPMSLSLLIELANYYRNFQFKWIVVGDGMDMPIIQQQINHLPQNFTVNLLGEKDNRKVHEIYKKIHIDWNILLSESEGLGITICEGFAYGVPAIVTNVGGLSEVVDDNFNGLLLSSTPKLTEIVEKISTYMYNQEKYNDLRNNAYNKWKNLFDSRKQRYSFIEEIKRF